MGQRQLCGRIADRQRPYEASLGYHDALGHVLQSDENAAGGGNYLGGSYLGGSYLGGSYLGGS
jgi:hypothetical protein